MRHKKTHYNVIMGDFNVKVGKGDEDCVGSFGYGVRNYRGDDLINFATAHGFKIMNTYYKKKKNRRWTWRSPNFETFNEIDYVLVDKNNIVKNFEVLNKVNVDSDHRMIRCKVQIDSKQERKRLFYSKPEPLRVCKQIVNEFKIDLQNRYAALEEQQDDSNNSISLNDMNNNITEPLIGAGKKWKSSTKRNSKFSEETKNFMEKRINLKTPTTAKEKIEATELNKLIRKKQRNDLRKHKATTIQRVIEQGKSFKMAKRQLNRGRLQFTSVLEEDGTLTTDRERIVERSREFYEKLYSSTRQEPPEADIKQQFEGFPNIKAWEVKSAVKQSKKGKAPGPDNITIDLIDVAGDIINDKLATLFNECLLQSKVPEIWNEAIIILLHKKGDQKNISNYRPISLLNNIYKLFTKIITNRITRTLD